LKNNFIFFQAIALGLNGNVMDLVRLLNLNKLAIKLINIKGDSRNGEDEKDCRKFLFV